MYYLSIFWAWSCGGMVWWVVGIFDSFQIKLLLSLDKVKGDKWDIHLIFLRGKNSLRDFDYNQWFWCIKSKPGDWKKYIRVWVFVCIIVLCSCVYTNNEFMYIFFSFLFFKVIGKNGSLYFIKQLNDTKS